MTDVYLLAHLSDEGIQINGVFTSRAAASAACRDEEDAVVTMPLNVDLTDERTFEIERPLTGEPPRMFTA